MSVTPTYTDMVSQQKYAGFASTDADRQALISELVGDSAQDLNPNVYCSKYCRAVYLLTAHKLTLLDAEQAAADSVATAAGANPQPSVVVPGGQLTSLSVAHGNQSASWSEVKATGATESWQEWLRTTRYGRELAMLSCRTPKLGWVT